MVTWLLRSEGRSSIPEDMPIFSYTLTAYHDLKQFLSIVYLLRIVCQHIHIQIHIHVYICDRDWT